MRSHVLILDRVVFVLMLLAPSERSFSQTTTAQLAGTITDSSGGAVAGANVAVTSAQTGLKRSTVSSDLGNYTIPLLPPGEYRAEVQMDGFRTVVRSGIQLAVRQQARIDFELEVGAVAEVVEVTGTAPLLQSETATISTLINSRAVAELPLVSGVSGRDPVDLVHVLPGATNRGIAGTQAVNGARMGTMDVQLDGVTKQLELDGVSSGARGTPSVDAVAEFKLMTNVYSAEYGRTGGATVVLTVKPGTNEFHGNLHWFLRNDKLAARNFFAASKLPLRSNMWGATLGGPIIKNRTFFFFSYEAWKFRTDSNVRLTVPSALEKQGDFSETRNSAGTIVPIYDPATLRASPSGSGFVRDQFANNRIPQGQIDPVAAKLVPYYEPANLPGAPFTRVNNFRVFHPTGRDLGPQIVVRADHQLTSKNNLSGRAFYHNAVQENVVLFANNFNPGSNNPDEFNKSVVLTDTHVFTPRLLNEARFGVNRQLDRIIIKFPADDAAALIGLKGMPVRAPMPPRFDIIGMASLGGGEDWKNVQNIFEWSDAITYVTGKHNLRIGFNYRRFQFNRQQRNTCCGGQAGQFGFAGVFTNLPGQPGTGFGLADVLLGMPASASVVLQPGFGFRSWYAAGFVQDDFKVTPKLTLNLGLRYDAETPFSEVNGKMSTFDPSLTDPVTKLPGALRFAGIGGRLVDTDYNNWGPRFGFAWSPVGKFVVRGGYSILYAPLTRGARINPEVASGFSATTSFSTLDNLTAPFTLAGGLPFFNTPAQDPPSSFDVGQTTIQLNPRNRVSYVQQWSFGLERELPGSMLMDASYVGTKGTKLPWGQQWNLNQLPEPVLGPTTLERVPNPFVGVITGSLGGPTITRGRLMTAFPQYLNVLNSGDASASSIYHSVQLKVEKSYSQGLYFLASYTGSKLLTDAGCGSGGVVCFDTQLQNNYNRRAERGLPYPNISQRFVGLALYELPFGKGKRWANTTGWKNQLAGGWQLNLMWTVQTGQRLTIFNSPNLTNSLGGGSRPNRVCDGNLSGSERSTSRWFDTSCFVAPPQFAFGNSGVGILPGPGLFNTDFSVFKTFSVKERATVQFRAEFFNFLNHTNFGNPGNTLGVGNFGIIASTNGGVLDFTGGPRDIQLGLKFVF